MTIKDVADLLFAARGRIDFYWNFYVVVVIAVIGWLVSLKKTLPVGMKALVTVAYVVAAAMNLAGLYSSYTFAEALRTDLLRMASATPLTDTRLILERHSYLSQRLVAVGVHLAIGASILLVVWFAHFPHRTRIAPAAAAADSGRGTSPETKGEITGSLE